MSVKWGVVVSLFKNRDEAAVSYARLIRDHGADWEHWPSFNQAIIDRWSPAALVYIKEKAWKRIERAQA